MLRFRGQSKSEPQKSEPQKSEADMQVLYLKMSKEFEEPTFSMLKDVEYLPRDYSGANGKPPLEHMKREMFSNMVPKYVNFDDEEPVTGRAKEYSMKATIMAVSNARYYDMVAITADSEVFLRKTINKWMDSMLEELIDNLNNPEFPDGRLKEIWGAVLTVRESSQINTTIGSINYLLKVLKPTAKANKDLCDRLVDIGKLYHQEVAGDPEDYVGMLRSEKKGDGSKESDTLSYFS